MADPLIGEMIARYQIVNVLGTGAMGTVYRATHEGVGHEVAIKVMRPGVSKNPKLVQRFLREAKAVASLRVPGVPQMHDVGTTQDGRAYLVMELLHGESLGERLKRDKKLPVQLALVLGRDVARALDAAHSQGIIHRDLKPDNIFIVKDASVQGGERAKVLDFGVAKLSFLQEQEEEMTMASEMLGTPLYMAPEQCQGAKQVDARADIYSLGCILYCMLCGVPPFGGETLAEIIAGHMAREPMLPSLYDPAVPGEVDALILQCLVKRRAQRLGSMSAFVDAVDAFFAKERSAGESHKQPGGEGPRFEHTVAMSTDDMQDSLDDVLSGQSQSATASEQQGAPSGAVSDRTIPISSELLHDALRSELAPESGGQDGQSFADKMADYTIPIDSADIDEKVAEAKQRRERAAAGASETDKESWAFTQPLKPGQREQAQPATGQGPADGRHAAPYSSPHSAPGAPMYSSPGDGQRPPMHSLPGDDGQHSLPDDGQRPPKPMLPDDGQRPPMLGAPMGRADEPALKLHHYIAIAGFVLVVAVVAFVLLGN